MSKKIRMVEGTPKIEIDKVIPYANNARINDNAVPALMASIRSFGFNEPIVLDSNNVIVCGHTRVKAAKQLGMVVVPCVYVEGLTEKEINAYRLADNKVAEQALWDYEKLEREMRDIGDSIRMTDFGFPEQTTPNLSSFFEPSTEPAGQQGSSQKQQAKPEGNVKHVCPNCGEEFED